MADKMTIHFLSLPKDEDFIFNKYCQALGVKNNLPLSQQTLDILVDRHTRFIPWENIDWFIDRNRKGTPDLDLTSLVERYDSNQHLGGLCYQLNLTFAWLLKKLGFNVSVHSVTITAFRDYIYQEPLSSHLLPIVHIGTDKRIICDVGWFGLTKSLEIPTSGASFLSPPFTVRHGEGPYCVILEQSVNNTLIQKQYSVHQKPLNIKQFEYVIDYSQAPSFRADAGQLVYMGYFAGGWMSIDGDDICIRYDSGNSYKLSLGSKHPAEAIQAAFDWVDKRI